MLVYREQPVQVVEENQHPVLFFAAFLTRINENCFKAGKMAIGFVNSALFKSSQVLHDITKSDQYRRGVCGGKAFNATTGWDSMTGLGTSEYPALVKFL